jgi:hypothetical protein
MSSFNANGKATIFCRGARSNSVELGRLRFETIINYTKENR